MSAGRVQSPALRMIVERELEIEKFISQEYWTIEADLTGQSSKFKAKLVEYLGKKLEQFSLPMKNKPGIWATLNKAAQGKLIVEKITTKSKKTKSCSTIYHFNPSTRASRKLGFSTQRTMRVAQQLMKAWMLAMDRWFNHLYAYRLSKSCQRSIEWNSNTHRRAIWQRFCTCRAPRL